MKSNLTTNMGNVLGNRINMAVKSALNESFTSKYVEIANTRAGIQQRYGAIQLEDIKPSQYAMFGSWSNSGLTVGP